MFDIEEALPLATRRGGDQVAGDDGEVGAGAAHGRWGGVHAIAEAATADGEERRDQRHQAYARQHRACAISPVAQACQSALRTRVAPMYVSAATKKPTNQA